MVTRLRMTQGLAGIVALAVVLNALPSRADDGGGDFDDGRGPGRGSDGDRGGGRDRDGDSDDSGFEDANAEDAAMAAACGYARSPSGSPLNRDGEVRESWKWTEGSKASKIEFTGSKAKKAFYKNPLCEQYVMIKIEDSLRSGKGAVRARCERIRDDLFSSNEELRKGGDAGGGSSFSLRDSLTSGNRRSRDSDGDDDRRETACESGEDPEADFACSYLDHKELLGDESAQRQAAKEIVSFCKSKGADMTISWDTYASYTGSGLDAYGGGYCGPRGGPIIVRKENKWYDTLGNVTLGLTKVLAPIASMTYISHLQQKNAERAIDANTSLGFPSGVSAGQSGMYGVGGGIGGGSCHGGGIYGGSGCGGWGCGGGMPGCGGGGLGGGGMGGGLFVGGGPCVGSGCGGGCGGGLPYGYGSGGCGGVYGGGLGGVIGGGCAYTGLGGGCPYGAAYGNGGITVGGTGMGPYGGAYGGGMCGVPPYGAGGCGGGGLGGGFGGGFPGGYPGYGAGGYPGGYGAGGGIGNPYGTINGANGVGNPYGANGMYGQAPYWGNSPVNANYAAQQAQQYQQWAVQMARQSTQSAQYARLYQDNMKDLQKVQEKAYQSYTAYQQASAGMAYGAAGVGGGYTGAGAGYGTGWAGQGGYAAYQGASAAPTYYPPYNSGGNRVNFGFSYSGR